MFSLFLFSVVPSLLYFCFADAYLHLAVFLNTLSLTYQKKKKTKLPTVVIFQRQFYVFISFYS